MISCFFALLGAFAQSLKVLGIGLARRRRLQAFEHRGAQLAAIFVPPDEFADVLARRAVRWSTYAFMLSGREMFMVVIAQG